MKNIKLNKIFTWFETRIEPYPEANPITPSKGLLRFIWSNLEGVRVWILVLAILTAGIGIMEALLFQFMGKLVDWLGKFTPETLFAEKGWALFGMVAMMIFAVFGILLHPMCACKLCRACSRCGCVGIFTA